MVNLMPSIKFIKDFNVFVAIRKTSCILVFNMPRLMFYIQFDPNPHTLQTEIVLFKKYIKILIEFQFYRDNAVYRSNSFKFERRGPTLPEAPQHVPPSSTRVTSPTSQISHKLDQVQGILSKKLNKSVAKEVIFI